MLRMLEAQAPAKQSVTHAIDTYSSRLSNATLLEDRRDAIDGLRSFAKDYPASVASSSLRPLIACLARDFEDVDTVNRVLETLLRLFEPALDSPEASEDIAFWLADEFTQHQDNIRILLDLLDTTDFFHRLYSLRLLICIFALRPERTQECVLNAALGTSRLVATLEADRNEIRLAGLELLRDLTYSSPELQKLVAFENAFDRTFSLIDADGGLGEGGIDVQYCLELLANLVLYNTSNQSLFRETGCVSKLASLLKNAYSRRPGSGDDGPGPQKDKNVYGLLSIIRLFLNEGGVGVRENQLSFEKNKLLQQMLELAFSSDTGERIKAEALYTCADMIRDNQIIQAKFGSSQVVPVAKSPAHNGTTNGIHEVYTIDALLELSIASPQSTSFDVRMASCECIKAYLHNHREIRHGFLSRAITLHIKPEENTLRVLTILLGDDSGSRNITDPYRIWFAADIIFRLIWEDSEAKSMLMKVSEGDAANGEEVVTCIQTISGNLIASIQKEDDERVLIGYLTVLCGWLFEDTEAVNDFLEEGSNIQALKQIMSAPGNDNGVIKGLCAVLLGIVYEYSTKDSPVPRQKLQPILTAQLGRERYHQALKQLRQHPLIRDFEVVPQGAAAAAAGRELPPYAYFDAIFVDFLKDNFSRLSRAIDRDPNIEVQIPSREGGIDRNLVDSLRAQLQNKLQALETAEGETLDLGRRLDQEQASNRKEQETATAEVNRIKQINEALQRNHEADVESMKREQMTAYQTLEASTSQQNQQLQQELEKSHKIAAEEAARTKEYYERTINQLRNAKTGMDNRVAEANKKIETAEQVMKQATDELKASKTRIEELERGLNERFQQVNELRAAETQLKEALESEKETLEDERTKISMLEKEVSELEATVKKQSEGVEIFEAQIKEKEEARSSIQTELDDLLMVLGDLEEKRANDKKRLKELGEEISDDEEEEDEDDVD